MPLNPTYRWPTPGGTDPMLYDDPVTVPAGDIADNPYWKRDARRAYPTLSFVNQGDAVALLGVGSAAAPKQDLVGEAGEKALAVAKEEGQKTGLAEFFEQKGKQGVLTAAQDLFVNGLPPMPSGQNLKADGSGAWEVKEYELLEDQSYGDGYALLATPTRYRKSDMSRDSLLTFLTDTPAGRSNRHTRKSD